MILSFAITSKLAKEHGISDPLYTGIKTVSRRSWSNKHAAAWIKAYREGRIIHDAWSKAPFVKGARKIGTFKLTCEPYKRVFARYARNRCHSRRWILGYCPRLY